MRNLPNKTDDVGDFLPASDFNTNLRSELQGVVTSAGLTLDPEGGPDTDVEMLGKSINIYANAGNYYSDSGSANAYILTRSGALKALAGYRDGTTVIFKASHTNTGAATVNVDSLGAIPITTSNGTALTGNEIYINEYVIARYNINASRFEIVFSKNINSWENIGAYFRPIVNNVGYLGDPTHLIQGAYFSGYPGIMVGTLQNLSLSSYGGASWITANEDINIVVSNANNIRLKTNNIDRWLVDPDGNFLPFISDTHDIGSADYRIRRIYQADNFRHYFGTNQESSIHHYGSSNYFILSTTNYNSISFRTSGGYWYIDGTYGNFYPNTSLDIGSLANRVGTVYCTTLNDISDRKQKTDIQSTLGLDFITKLNPCSFILKSYKETGRKHGLIAQEVLEVIEEMGLKREDFSAITHDENNENWGLSYNQFIGPIIQAIKELKELYDKINK